MAACNITPEREEYSEYSRHPSFRGTYSIHKLQTASSNPHHSAPSLPVPIVHYHTVSTQTSLQPCIVKRIETETPSFFVIIFSYKASAPSMARNATRTKHFMHSCFRSSRPGPSHWRAATTSDPTERLTANWSA